MAIFTKCREKIKRMHCILLLFTSGLLSWPLVCAAENWQPVMDGIDYIDLDSSYLTPWSHIHVFRIDPERYQFESIQAASLAKKHFSVNEIAAKEHALLAVNGGFFDHKYQPLGLRISNYHQQNPLKRISWWGIFYIKHHKPHIKSVREFRSRSGIHFAIQSGPRLIIRGKIPALKPGLAERTALGITKDNQVIVLATDNHSLSTSALAALMQKPPLSCIDAINLDGGNSTQLYADMRDLKLSVHGYSYVSDVVLIKNQEKRNT